MSPAEIIARQVEPQAWAALGVGDTLAYCNRRVSSERKAARILAALEAEGFVVVPSEPTDAMGAAALRVRMTPYGKPPDHDNPILTAEEKIAFNWEADTLAANPTRWEKPAYRAMLAARPR